MSIALNETFRVSASPDRVWQFLKSPADVVTCLPGAELTETIDAQTYCGRVRVKVGPITAKYAGKATLVEVDDVARRMQIVAEGKETGGAGSARMTLNGLVTPLADGTSEVRVDATIDIAGRVMQFGRGLIESINKQLFREFAEAVQTKLQDAHAAEVAAAKPSDALPPSPSGPARPETRGDDGIGTHAQRVEPPAQALRALPLLWKVFRAWLRGLFGRKR